MNQEKVNDLLDESTGKRVTKEYIERRITDTLFTQLIEGSTVTICQLTIDNGYSVRGESACVDPTNYNEDIGKHYAYEDAFKKLWPLFGFLLAERMYRGTVETVQTDRFAYFVDFDEFDSNILSDSPDHPHELTGEEPAFEAIVNLDTPFDPEAVLKAKDNLCSNSDAPDEAIED